MSILEELFSQLSSRDAILSVVMFVLGWAIAFYYHHRESRDLRDQLEILRTKLLGQTIDNIERNLENLEIVPDSLLDRLQTSMREPGSQI